MSLKRVSGRSSVAHDRSGVTLVMVAILIVALLSLVALAVDLGVLGLAKYELKRTADAASLAATAELAPPAVPRFPLKSPLAIEINVPDVLQAGIAGTLDTKATAAGTELTIIDASNQAVEPAALAAARWYAARNSTKGVSEFSLTGQDVRIFRRPDHPPSLPLIPSLPLGQSIVAAAESLLLANDQDMHNNTVQVTARRSEEANGAVGLYFAPVFGVSQWGMHQTSTATFYKGYGVRPGAKVLPVAMDVTIWRVLRLGNGLVNGVPLAQTLLAGNGQPMVLVDEQRWDPKSRAVSRGSDGVWEVLLLNRPLDEINLPGIFDGIDLASGGLPLGGGLGGLTERALQTPATLVSLNFSSNGGTASVHQLIRQIRFGLDQQDTTDRLMLPFTRDGQRSIANPVVEELQEIIGKPRIIPLFETISGTVLNKVRGIIGARQPYRIVGFGGVVVTDVRDLGVVKVIKLQPASVMSRYVIPASEGQPAALSDGVYTTPVLIE